MSSLKTALYNFLTQATGVSGVVGNRIFPGTAPTSAKLPYIVYQVISSPGTHHMGGQAKIANPTFQFGCYGRTSVDAENAKESVRNAIVGFRGKWDDVIISAVHLEQESDDFEIPDQGGEEGTFQERMTITIWYQREIPTFI